MLFQPLINVARGTHHYLYVNHDRYHHRRDRSFLDGVGYHNQMRHSQGVHYSHTDAAEAVDNQAVLDLDQIRCIHIREEVEAVHYQKLPFLEAEGPIHQSRAEVGDNRVRCCSRFYSESHKTVDCFAHILGAGSTGCHQHN
jgi:hypothetical protein